MLATRSARVGCGGAEDLESGAVEDLEGGGAESSTKRRDTFGNARFGNAGGGGWPIEKFGGGRRGLNGGPPTREGFIGGSGNGGGRCVGMRGSVPGGGRGSPICGGGSSEGGTGPGGGNEWFAARGGLINMDGGGGGGRTMAAGA